MVKIGVDATTIAAVLEVPVRQVEALMVQIQAEMSQ